MGFVKFMVQDDAHMAVPICNLVGLLQRLSTTHNGLLGNLQLMYSIDGQCCARSALQSFRGRSLV